MDIYIHGKPASSGLVILNHLDS